MLSEIHNELKREVYVKRLSELAKISVDTINAEIRRSSYKNARRAKKSFNEEIERKSLRYDDRINPQAASKLKETTLEQRILGIAMLYPEMLSQIPELDEGIFVTDFNKNLFVKIKELSENGEFDISALNEFYNPQEMSYILKMRNARQGLSANGKDVLAEAANALIKLKNASNTQGGTFLENIERIKAEKMKGC